MCPMRFILVFFSAVRRPRRLLPPMTASFKKMVENGFWGFVDMASGRYLWRWIKEPRGVLPEDTHPKTS